MGLKKAIFANWVKDFNEIKNKSEAINSEVSDIEAVEDGKRKNSQEPSNKRKLLKSDSVNRWLELIPKVPSHYCRASSSRVYVDSEFRSLNHMHQIYKEWCGETGSESVERKTFCEILESQKISIHKPRKDQCDSCIAFKEGNLKEEDYNMHVQKKNDARKAKEDAISSASDSVLVATMDVQSVLLCPKLIVSKQYYSQKLQIHNFTIYVCNTKDVVYIYMCGMKEKGK